MRKPSSELVRAMSVTRVARRSLGLTRLSARASLMASWWLKSSGGAGGPFGDVGLMVADVECVCVWQASSTRRTTARTRRIRFVSTQFWYLR